ncbi:MAG: TonB-dependent receptor [Saprospiraceae bacterium]|nr:TonB-dependent receptor [Saprospiraceae bacterium]
MRSVAWCIFSLKNPCLTLKKGNAFFRYGTVNNEQTAHVDYNWGRQELAILASATVSHFSDARMGKRTQALDTLWGLRRWKAQTFNNLDSMVINSDPFVQSQSGYSQLDGLVKVLYQPYNSKTTHLLNLQFSTSADIPRYDRLTDFDPARQRPRFAEWYYGPQTRFLGSYEFKIDDFNAILNYQQIEESRYTRRFRQEFLIGNVEKVDVLGWDFDYGKRLEKHDFRFGIEGQFGRVVSKGFQTNKLTDSIVPAITRYPDGDNFQLNNSIYLTHVWDISPVLTLNDGVRLTNVTQKSTFINKSFFPFPFDEAKQNVTALAGNVGLVYKPNQNMKLAWLVSTGFRVPNVDDLGKVFDSNDQQLIVPNPNISAERTYNFEFNPTVKLGSWLTLENSFFIHSSKCYQ